MFSNESVSGVYNVEGSNGNVAILRQGKKLVSIGDGYDTDAELRAEHVRIYRGNPIKVETYEVNMAGQSLKNISRYIAPEKEYRLFSRMLVLKEPAIIPVSSLSYNPVEVNGKILTLNFAKLEHVQRIQNSVVEEGIITVKYMLSPDDNTSMEIPMSPLIQEFDIDYRNEIQVAVDQIVLRGDYLVIRSDYRRDIALKESWKAHLLEEIGTIQDTHKEQLKYFEQEGNALGSQLEYAQDVAQADSILSNRGAVSTLEADARHVAVKELQAKLQRLKADVARELASFGSRMRSLHFQTARTENEIFKLRKNSLVVSIHNGIVKDILVTSSKDKLVAQIEFQPMQGGDDDERKDM